MFINEKGAASRVEKQEQYRRRNILKVDVRLKTILP